MIKKFFIGFGIVALILLIIGLPVYFGLTKSGRAAWNEWRYGLEKVDEKTYENQKEVENTCRAMIASYTQDKLVYEQYKDSEIEEERSWANNAKIRANQTASIYNNYILKNSYVWKGNIPDDIFIALEYIGDET